MFWEQDLPTSIIFWRKEHKNRPQIWPDVEETQQHFSVHLAMNSDHSEKEDHTKGKMANFW